MQSRAPSLYPIFPIKISALTKDNPFSVQGLTITGSPPAPATTRSGIKSYDRGGQMSTMVLGLQIQGAVETWTDAGI